MNLVDAIIDHILKVEGGYVNDPNDPGGETKFGISRRSYPSLDIEGLTIEAARAIYARDFVNPVLAEVNDPRLAFLAADAAVNHGLTRALAWLEGYPTFDGYLANRIRFYTSLKTLWPHFGRGWMNRVASVVNAANQFATTGFCDRIVDKRDVWTRVLSAMHGTSFDVNTTVRMEGREKVMTVS